MEIGENPNEGRGYHNELPFRYKLLMTIWWLGNQETYRQLADRFGTTRGNFLLRRKIEYHVNSTTGNHSVISH